MEICLIRHTHPVISKGLIYGRLDVPLLDSFTQEAELILQQLPSSFDQVYSSPASRCTQLAALINSKYLTEPALYELDFGDWEGKTWDTIDRQQSENWMNDFVNLSPPKGETMLQMESRILTFWNQLLLQPFQNVAVVTHGGVIRILLANQQSIPLKNAFSIPVAIGEVFQLSL
jgi:alpha-ribazole phosphatase